MSSSSFRLSVEIRLSGELDLLTASEVRSELLAVAKSTHAPEIAVDLEEVAFVDTAGLKPLVEAQRLLNRSDRTLRLRNVPLPVARLIRGPRQHLRRGRGRRERRRKRSDEPDSRSAS